MINNNLVVITMENEKQDQAKKENIFEVLKKNNKIFLYFSEIFAGFIAFALLFFIGLIFTNNGNRADTLEQIDDTQVNQTISANNEFFIRQSGVENDIEGNVVIQYELSVGLQERCKEGTCYVRSKISKNDETAERVGGPTVILRNEVAKIGDVDIKKSSLQDMFQVQDVDKLDFSVLLVVDVHNSSGDLIGTIDGVTENYTYEE